MAVDRDAVLHVSGFSEKQPAGPLGRRPRLGLRFIKCRRVARRRYRDADKVPAVLEVEHGVAEHIGKTLAIGRVVEQPGGEDEVERSAGIEGWFRTVGDDEVDAFVIVGAVRKGRRRDSAESRAAKPARLLNHDWRDVHADDGAGAPFEELVGVEAGTAGEFEDPGVGDEGRDGGLDVCVLDIRNGFFANMVVGHLDVVELGRHGGLGLWIFADVVAGDVDVVELG